MRKQFSMFSVRTWRRYIRLITLYRHAIDSRTFASHGAWGGVDLPWLEPPIRLCTYRSAVFFFTFALNELLLFKFDESAAIDSTIAYEIIIRENPKNASAAHTHTHTSDIRRHRMESKCNEPCVCVLMCCVCSLNRFQMSIWWTFRERERGRAVI